MMFSSSSSPTYPTAEARLCSEHPKHPPRSHCWITASAEVMDRVLCPFHQAAALCDYSTGPYREPKNHLSWKGPTKRWPSITLEALVARGLSKLWMALRSASIYKTCLARSFLLQQSKLICLILAFHVEFCFSEAAVSHQKEEARLVLRQHPAKHGVEWCPSLAGWLKAFFVSINTLIELCGLPSSRHLFRSGEQTLYIERYVSQNQSCVNLELPHLNNWGIQLSIWWMWSTLLPAQIITINRDLL